MEFIVIGLLLGTVALIIYSNSQAESVESTQVDNTLSNGTPVPLPQGSAPIVRTSNNGSYQDDGSDFLTSVAIGAVTGSALLGGIGGGSFVGGLVGASLTEDNSPTPISTDSNNSTDVSTDDNSSSDDSSSDSSYDSSSSDSGSFDSGGSFGD